MGRLILVSNRLPLSITKRKGKLNFKPSVGGLATGLSSLYKRKNGLWVGWPGLALKGEEREVARARLESERCHPVFLTQQEIEQYYHGFCNKTIWPLFHYFTQYVVYSKEFWGSYKKVNEKFRDAVLEVLKREDVIWVHDYHLMLLPKLLREEVPEACIGFFLHIPFPSYEVFRLLPWRKELLLGMLGADLIGFHTYDYAQHFLNSVRRILGYEHTLGQINTEERVVKVDAFPMGIDYARFSKALKSPSVRREVNRLKRKAGKKKVILSIDRLDYTKGIPLRLEAFDLFLEKNPKYLEDVVYILVAVPSRSRVEHYIQLKKRIDELVGQINGKYGTLGWSPIWYLYRFLPFHTLVALYRIADVAMVTPLRDGMNLISKEFVATKRGKGVLILSEMAGAAKELGEALIVNPNNLDEVAEALKEALSMPEREQIRRNVIMKRRIRRYDVLKWGREFLGRLSYVKELQKGLLAKELSGRERERMLRKYSRAKSRLLLLDYDGTLIPFSEKPEDAKPDRELIEILKGLSSDERNEIVVISGRDRDSLELWFSELDIGLVAEHGAWIREGKGMWEMVEPLRSDWKDTIRPILELYVDRTPGSFIEEKEFSLVWHYRKADPELGRVRASELKDNLLHLTVNLNLRVLEGSKVIEIKNVGVDKGKAAQRWIRKRRWGFILAAGDDWTDEDLFSSLPEWAYSIKVGKGSSSAKFNVDSPFEVRKLLREFTELAKGRVSVKEQGT